MMLVATKTLCLKWFVLVPIFALCSCGVRRDFVAFESLEDEAQQALRDRDFGSFLTSLGDDAAVRMSALMLREDTFPTATWGLTQLTLRSNSPVSSHYVFSMARASYEEAIFSSGIDEAITALSMFYPEGMDEFVKESRDVESGMSWVKTRIIAARLFGLASLYYNERVRSGKPPINFHFHHIPGRTVREGEGHGLHLVPSTKADGGCEK